MSESHVPSRGSAESCSKFTIVEDDDDDDFCMPESEETPEYTHKTQESTSKGGVREEEAQYPFWYRCNLVLTVITASYTGMLSLLQYGRLRERVTQWRIIIGQRVKRLHLLIFFFITNLVIYFDRMAVASSLGEIERDFELRSWQSGMLAAMFMVGYMCTSPLFGQAVRSMPSTHLMGIGLAVFCVSTFATGASVGFKSILAARILTGVGEASFAGLVLAYIKRIAPKGKDTLWVSIYLASMAFGSALGYISGGVCSAYLSWRVSFLLESAMILPSAILCVLIPTIEEWNELVRKKVTERLRKSQEEVSNKYPEAVTTALEISQDDGDVLLQGEMYSDAHEEIRRMSGGDLLSQPFQRPSLVDSLKILANYRVYLIVVAGNSLLSFVTGALGFWIPTYVRDELNVPIDLAAAAIGIMTVFSGVFGSILSTMLVDYLTHKANWRWIPVMQDETKKRSVITVRLVVVLILFEAVCLSIISFTTSRYVFFLVFFVALFAFLSCIGPINNVLLDLVPAEHREFAMSVEIFAIHLFGDFPSPLVVGVIRDHWGMRPAMWILTLWILGAFGAFSWAEVCISTENLIDSMISKLVPNSVKKKLRDAAAAAKSTVTAEEGAYGIVTHEDDEKYDDAGDVITRGGGGDGAVC